MRQCLRDERGFTMVEVVTVLLILAVLVAIVMATYYHSSDRAIQMADRANLRIIRSALEQYRSTSPSGSYPAALDDLHPTFIRSKESFKVPGTGVPYGYDPATGDVRDPDHPER